MVARAFGLEQNAAVMDRRNGVRQTIFICLLLSAVTLAVYWPVRHHEFVNYDDPDYVTDNAEIQGGISTAGLAWAFFNLHGKSTYWHPLTWVSHMLDCQLFGLNPGPHHLVNVLFHMANTVLVFLLLNRMTGFVWRSAMVAALFGLHPLQVDTVAWVTERKNVLSTLFWLLTMLAYVRYVEERRKNAECRMQNAAGPSHEPESRLTRRASRFTFHVSPYYLLSCCLFALGLMCKPALVTLPFVLLLMDFWPLRRLEWTRGTEAGGSSPQPAPKSGGAQNEVPLRQSGRPAEVGSSGPRIDSIRWLILEKVPLLVLAAASCLATTAAHQGLRILRASNMPLEWRIENAVVSYVRYLGKTVWPEHLAVFYPHPGAWPAVAVTGSLLVLIVLCGLVLWQARRAPYLVTGWLWFLGVLVPMIGIVQAGAQAMADRFAYVPLIGLFIMIVWGLADLTTGWAGRNKILTTTGLLALGGCVVLTSRQLSYWENSVTLFEHTLRVTENNFLAHHNLGLTLGRQGKYELASSHFRASLAVYPDQPEPHYNRGLSLMALGKLAEAVEEYQATLQLNPSHRPARNNLAATLLLLGKLDEAAAQFSELARLEPSSPDYPCSLGGILLRQGKFADAETDFAEAVRRRPDFIPALAGLGQALSAQSKFTNAQPQFREVVRLRPASADAHANLGLCYARQRKLDEAVLEFQEQLRLQPDAQAWYNLALARVMQGNLKEAAADYEQAVKLKPDWPIVLNDLAWIRATAPRAELRDSTAAVRMAERACELSGGQEARFFGTLDAAYAEAGRFADAITTAEKTRDLALAAGDKEIATAAQQRMALYRDRQPYRQ
jgi:tetratricopeptide (TPR) repeat protein